MICMEEEKIALAAGASNGWYDSGIHLAVFFRKENNSKPGWLQDTR